MSRTTAMLPGHTLLRHAPRPGELRTAPPGPARRPTLLVLALPSAERAGIVG